MGESKRTVNKDIFVSNNKLSLNIKDIIKLCNEFMILLKSNKDVTYYLDDKYNNNDINNNKLKIMFRNIVSGNDNNNNNNNIKYEMVNNWTVYKNININNRFIREAIIYRDNINNPLISWIDFICLSDNLNDFNEVSQVSLSIINNNSNMLNVNVMESVKVAQSVQAAQDEFNLFNFNNFKIVERHINDIKFTWDDFNLINRNKKIRKSKIINTKEDLLNIIQPIETIITFKNFVQSFKVPTLEELPHEQEFDNKIGVLDLETCTRDINEKNNYCEQNCICSFLILILILLSKAIMNRIEIYIINLFKIINNN